MGLLDGADPDAVLRALGGRWASLPCDRCGDRTYTIPVSAALFWCFGCREPEDECTCGDRDDESET